MKDRPYDKNGIPVYAGDVLKTYHFKARPHGRIMYLYHVAVECEHKGLTFLEGRPASELSTDKDKGGRFVLREDDLIHTEIVQGYGPDNMLFIDRPRKPKGGEAQ